MFLIPKNAFKPIPPFLRCRHIRRHIAFGLAVLLTSLACIGCHATIPMPEVPIADAQVQILDKPQHHPKSMRLTARVDYVDEKNAQRAVGQDLILSATDNGSMRLTISAFDKSVAVLVTDGTTFALIDATQNAYITGRASADNIAQILPVRLSASDLHRVLFGAYPIDNLAQNADALASFHWDSKLGGYVYTLPLAQGGTQKVYYRWPSGDIFRIDVTDENDKSIYLYEASDFTDKTFGDESYRFPNKILFQLPLDKTDVQLRIDKRDLNVEFNPAVFRLFPPQGAKIYVSDGISPETPTPSEI